MSCFYFCGHFVVWIERFSSFKKISLIFRVYAIDSTFNIALFVIIAPILRCFYDNNNYNYYSLINDWHEAKNQNCFTIFVSISSVYFWNSKCMWILNHFNASRCIIGISIKKNNRKHNECLSLVCGVQVLDNWYAYGCIVFIWLIEFEKNAKNH